MATIGKASEEEIRLGLIKVFEGMSGERVTAIFTGYFGKEILSRKFALDLVKMGATTFDALGLDSTDDLSSQEPRNIF